VQVQCRHLANSCIKFKQLHGDTIAITYLVLTHVIRTALCTVALWSVGVTKLCLFCDFNNMNSLNFNIDNGYLEGLVRGFKAGILKQSDYANLVQCETLEGK